MAICFPRPTWAYKILVKRTVLLAETFIVAAYVLDIRAVVDERLRDKGSFRRTCLISYTILLVHCPSMRAVEVGLGGTEPAQSVSQHEISAG